MAAPQLIGLDWGTTSCRAYLIGAGGVFARIADGPGILRVEKSFGAALDAMIGPWIAAHGALPVLLSGMIGSRQGWAETAYAQCPAGARDIVRALTAIEHAGRTVWIGPGPSSIGTPLSLRRPNAGYPARGPQEPPRSARHARG